MLFLSYNQLAELFANIFGKTVEGGIIPGQIVKDLARWRIIFILKIVSQLHRQSLKQFAVQEVFPAYVVKGKN